jgi:hypothetical protein
MNESFISLFAGGRFYTVQLWEAGLGMSCSALNLVCGITVNAKRHTGTDK